MKMMTDDEKRLAVLLRDFFGESVGNFKPCAIYNRNLDTISVLIEDCSVTEVPVTPTSLLILHERNYDEDGRPIEQPQVTHVGFSIESAQRFSRTHGLPHAGKVRISDILKRLSEIEKETVPAILDIVMPMILEHHLDEIEFPAA